MAESKLPVAIAEPSDLLADAVRNGGGEVVPVGAQARALIWNRFHQTAELPDVLRQCPSLQWVQLPSAGVDDFVSAQVLDPAYIWTSAKGAYARPVAEHALTLTLALLRKIPERVRAREWGKQAGTSLFGLHVAIIGAGGIATEFLRLTAPFGIRSTVIRKSGAPVEGVDQTVTPDQLSNILPDVDVLLIATPLTDETRGMIGAAQFAALPSRAIVVNVARGPIIRTDDLIEAVRSEQIAGAALDVTDPEPLPKDHPLWNEPRVLITPHTADTADMIKPLLAERISENIRSFVDGKSLIGIVDIEQGY